MPTCQRRALVQRPGGRSDRRSPWRRRLRPPLLRVPGTDHEHSLRREPAPLHPPHPAPGGLHPGPAAGGHPAGRDRRRPRPTPPRTNTDPRRLAERSTAWRARLDDQIDRLRRLRDRLTVCIGCGCLSLRSCPLANPDDVLGQQGQGGRRLLGGEGEAGEKTPPVAGATRVDLR